MDLSQRRAARLAGVSETAWRNVERGRELRGGVIDPSPNQPQRTTVRKIAKLLGWNVRDAMRWAGYDDPGPDDEPAQEQPPDPRDEITEILPQLSAGRALALLYVARSMLDAEARIPDDSRAIY
jgi:DNA-binding XRE family transcriptional regulator